MLNNPLIRWQYRLERKRLGIKQPHNHIVGLRYDNVSDSHYQSAVIFGLCLLLAGLMLLGSCQTAHAEEIIAGHPLSAWVTAIRHAEGNNNYGILSVACTPGADCRRICANTVRNNYRRWIKAGRPGTYLAYLAHRYCPIGASNDPRGLNRNWKKNVAYWLDKNKGA